MTLILILAKIFILPLLFIFTIGIVNILPAMTARVLFNTPNAQIPFYVIFTILYAYLYVLWGAFLRAVVLNYSSHLNKWFLIVLCFVSISSSIRHINNEKESERAVMNQMIPFDDKTKKDIMSKSMTVVCLSLSPFIFVSFITFFFTEGLYETSFFKLALVASKWFM